jgi:plastocyanin
MTSRGLITALFLILFLLAALYITNMAFKEHQNKDTNNPTKSEIQEFYIEINNHKFHPDIIQAKAGTKIRLIVKNNDSIAEEFESTDLNREKIIAPYQSVKIILAPLNPGDYKFFGEFHPNSAQGILQIK